MARNSTPGELYALFMQEIKQRLNKVERIIFTVRIDHHGEEPSYLVELAFLQIRFICELTALASLSAHEEYGLKKDLLKKWHADVIFEELEGINPHCFPTPVKATSQDGVATCTPWHERKITRAQLKDIYGQCGRLLHAGVLKHALQGKSKTYNLGQLEQWFTQLRSLLAQHAILLPKHGKMFIINLFDDAGGRVMVAQAEGDGPIPIPEGYR